MAGRTGRVISPAATSRPRLGYVHNVKGDMFLVHPRKDFWQSGAEGPGFYHQIGADLP
jgi:hypothetical protein